MNNDESGVGTTQVVSCHECPNCGEEFDHDGHDYCYVGWPANSGNNGGFCCSRECAIEAIENAE